MKGNHSSIVYSFLSKQRSIKYVWFRAKTVTDQDSFAARFLLN